MIIPQASGLFMFKSSISLVLASLNVLDKGVLPLEKDSVGIQFYIDAVNEARRTCRIQTLIEKCCLTDEKESDCNCMNVYGVNNITIKPDDRKSFIFVYPTLYQYDQVGYCEFVISYQCFRGKRSKISVSIPFDTIIFNRKKQPYMISYKDENIVTKCDTIDEDPLNDCKMINCDLKYSGEKPFYDAISKKCLRAPDCTCDIKKELPDLIYLPNSNICKDLEHPLTISDIYAISTGLGVVTESPKIKENNVKIELYSNCTTISQNLMLLKDMMCGKLCPIFNGDISSYTSCMTSTIMSILGCIIAICIALLAFVCCVHTTVSFYLKWSKGDLNNCYHNLKAKIRNVKMPKSNESRINKDVTNALLREVIIKDLPIELRSSMVDICDRIRKEVRWKKRYRINDLGSQINLNEADSDFTMSTVSSSDTSREVKHLN